MDHLWVLRRGPPAKDFGTTNASRSLLRSGATRVGGSHAILGWRPPGAAYLLELNVQILRPGNEAPKNENSLLNCRRSKNSIQPSGYPILPVFTVSDDCKNGRVLNFDVWNKEKDFYRSKCSDQ